eukprot:1632809-Pyramimonas_sp.AAC.2
MPRKKCKLCVEHQVSGTHTGKPFGWGALARLPARGARVQLPRQTMRCTLHDLCVVEIRADPGGDPSEAFPTGARSLLIRQAPESTVGQPCGSLSARNMRRKFGGIFEMLQRGLTVVSRRLWGLAHARETTKHDAISAHVRQNFARSVRRGDPRADPCAVETGDPREAFIPTAHGARARTRSSRNKL